MELPDASTTGSQTLTLTFHGSHSDAIAKLTSAHLGDELAFTYNDRVFIAPSFESAIMDGQLVINIGDNRLVAIKAFAAIVRNRFEWWLI